MEDAFDAKLAAAFARADAQISASQQFVEQLLRRLGRTNRQRWMILGSAASAGSLIAASQLERLADNIHFETGMFAQVFAIIPPQAMTSMALAAIMTAFGMVLPATNR
ncbi:hypothetical protein MNBD_ALPHA06-155 [hydrothermal vent metagenome]|uniref:Uncharacterized protein n=1 Tax=hydrothermal vent metagenome TaxID=652676 RepID=A0A3B0RS59_9ZZZZ